MAKRARRFSPRRRQRWRREAAEELRQNGKRISQFAQGEPHWLTPLASTSASQAFVADTMGALYWPDERLLVVADLHLEKGSAYAARRVFLPPYDTAVTLGDARCAHRALCAADNRRTGQFFS